MFELSVKTDNAAFDDLRFELTRILKEVAAAVEGGALNGSVRDSNGNTVGRFTTSRQGWEKIKRAGR